MRIDVLGVRFDELTMEETLSAALCLMAERRGAYVVTPNPEIIRLCRRYPAVSEAVNGAALVLPDGVGDLYAARILGTPLKERVSGSDLTPRLFAALEKQGGSVFLFGARPGVAERAAEKLRTAYPGVRVVGTEHGYITDDGPLLTRLSEAAPDLLLVCMGAPKQELWMRQHQGLPGVGLMLGLGGYLDVLSGDKPRAPAAWQKRGLEWLYRLLREPWRVKRVAGLPGVLLLALQGRARRKKDSRRSHL